MFSKENYTKPTLVQNGCADLAQYNFSYLFDGSEQKADGCCNNLTACYYNCESNKDLCDEEFNNCLKKVAEVDPSTCKYRR